MGGKARAREEEHGVMLSACNVHVASRSHGPRYEAPLVYGARITPIDRRYLRRSLSYPPAAHQPSQTLAGAENSCQEVYMPPKQKTHFCALLAMVPGSLVPCRIEEPPATAPSPEFSIRMKGSRPVFSADVDV